MEAKKERPLTDWEKNILMGYRPHPGPVPENDSRTYKDQPKNEWLIAAVNKIGGKKRGNIKVVAKIIKRTPTYLYNVTRGYCPMSKELEESIKEALERV